ncbi:hypothetical protein [uncultured Croceitalea sp.]|uniref:hypothetical protein n=1 Tax=uncultured Croceitalea sp. TaxID=1798908 RepID=UPI003305F478
MAAIRKILIPIDFNVRSLKLATYAFELYPKEVVNLMLVYPYRLPLWDVELYWFSPRKIITELNNEAFSRAKDELVNRFYANICSIEMTLFTGVNSIAFKNFINHHKVQTAIIPQNGFLDFSHGATFDSLRLIQKNMADVRTIAMDKKDDTKQSTERKGFNVLR